MQHSGELQAFKDRVEEGQKEVRTLKQTVKEKEMLVQT